MRWTVAIGIFATVFALIPLTVIAAESPNEEIATAERNTTERIRSRDGTWSIPIASNILSSDTHLHHARGSERANGAFDISAPIGTSVYAPCRGVANHTSLANEGGYGNNVQVTCAATGLTIWIGHLHDIVAKRGQDVTEDTVIGTVGRTGTTSFNHIHITLRNSKNNRIESHFDMSLFHWSPFADPTGSIYEWSGSNTIAASKVPSIPPLITGASIYGPFAMLTALIYAVVSAMIHALSKDYQPVARRQIILGSCHGLLVLFVLMGVLTGFSQVVAHEVNSRSNTVSDAHEGATRASGSDFDRAFAFTISWEGWECTHDPIRTMGGITKHTYAAWLAKRGLPVVDVCENLTKAERKQILREGYWEGGADEHEWPMSAAIFDMAVGSGQSAARRLLKTVDTYEEYQEERRKFYRTMRTSKSYANAWLNRVDDLGEYIETGEVKGR